MAAWQRPIYWVVLFALGLMVQTALLPEVFPVGYVPSIMLSLVVVLALYETPRGGLALGLVGGALTDLLGGRLIGLNTLTFGVLGYVIASYQPRWRHDQIVLPGVVGALSQLVMGPAQWLLLHVIGYPVAWQMVSAPLPYLVLFSLLFTPAVGAILGLRPESSRSRRGGR
ncbi:MAG: rod shape-determining protein MreD [Firmicutes bacterium]|jgi:rod shape-determining protein MreD|nr:rod shape-determining protein MreD [Bacillota bacterium]MCL5064654.1 rod shape-determining protein MreD [Bacillota bacterium]